MAIKTAEEIINDVREILGEDSSDNAIALIENISDTLNSLNNTDNGETWKQKYETNDAMWRKKYRDRFFSPVKDEPDDEIAGDKPKKYTFESLFKEG